MGDIVAMTEGGEYRVRLEVDPYPEPPYDEGAAPIVRVWRGRYGTGWTAEQVAYGSPMYALPCGILGAFEKYGPGDARVGRYLRAFHGVTRVAHSRYVDGGWFVSFDPADWRALAGELEGSDAPGAALSEWVAHLEEDVWGWVVERLEMRETVWKDLAGQVTHAEEAEDWLELESCWGFHGRESAERAARDALAEVTGEQVAP